MRNIYPIIFLFVTLPVFSSPQTSETLKQLSTETLHLNLELIELPNNDLQQAKFKLTATNNSSDTIVLDNEFSVGFSIQFGNPPSNWDRLFGFHNDFDVSIDDSKTTRAAVLNKTKAKNRFVALEPGQAISRDYDMSKGMKTVVMGHIYRNDQIYGREKLYIELLFYYKVSVKAKDLRIQANYEKDWKWAKNSFKWKFGNSPEELGIWDGKATSNILVIKKK